MAGGSRDGWVGRGIDEAVRLLGGGAWEATTLHGTGGALYGSSVARLRSGEDSVIVKVVRSNDSGHSESASWRRELDLYRSDWLNGVLPAGLAMPACPAATETEEAAVIVLEDVDFDDRDARSVDWYGRLAEQLGLLNARPVGELPQWASRGFVRSETEHLTAFVPAMSASTSPLIADLTTTWFPVLVELATAAPDLLARLDATAHGFHHLDAFSRNAAEVGDRMILIDWAYAGWAPIGTDAAGIVAMTGMHGDIEHGELVSFYASVVDGFLSGLAAAGYAADAEVEANVELLLTLRWSGFLGQVHHLGDGLADVAESVAGRPLDEVLAAWRALSELVMPIAERVLRRANT